MIINLGVLDIPYVQAPQEFKWRKNSKSAKKIAKFARYQSLSTFNVAQFIESKYGLMAAFAEKNMPYIADQMANSLAGAIEVVLSGSMPAGFDPYGSATSAIEHRFKEALSLKEFDGLPGVPTAASLKGTTSRKASKKGGSRPSFIDTGVYQASFKSWVDEK